MTNTMMFRRVGLVGLLGISLLAGEVARAEEDGGALFVSRCVACHQNGGVGMPGEFPPLAGRLGFIAQRDGGRDYLIDVLLFGLRGKIHAQGNDYAGYMPSFNKLNDEQIAALLRYATGIKAPAADIQASQIAAARAKAKSVQDVAAERAALEKTGKLP